MMKKYSGKKHDQVQKSSFGGRLNFSSSAMNILMKKLKIRGPSFVVILTFDFDNPSVLHQSLFIIERSTH